MKITRKIIIAIIGIAVILSLICAKNQIVNAQKSENDMQEQIEYYARNIDLNNITKEDILKVYDEVVAQYSPENIAQMIEQSEEELEAQGVSKEVLQAGANFIKETDTESIRKMIEEDVDVESIKQKVQQGYTADQIVSSIIEETPTHKKAEIVTKVLFANKTIKTVATILIILFIYGTIIRWIIYTKAGKPGFAAIIPIYRQIVMYQICGLSPLLMLLWFVPIIGWIAMFVIAIMKRFCLAKEFGQGTLFGFGLLLLQPIFQSIIAFNPNIKKLKKD